MVQLNSYLFIKFHVPTCNNSGQVPPLFTLTPPVGTDAVAASCEYGTNHISVPTVFLKLGMACWVKGNFLPRTWGLVLRVLTWGYPEVGGNSEGACPSGQQDSFIPGLQDDCHTQTHTSILGPLSFWRLGLLVQGHKRAERALLAGGRPLG